MSEAPYRGDEDQRGAPRAVLELTVRLRFDTGEQLSAITANVSAAGMYVRARQPPPVGAMVRFELDLPALREPIRGTGEVVWIRVRPEGPERPPGLGIRFRHVDEEAFAALRLAIDEHLAATTLPPDRAEWYTRRPEPELEPEAPEDEPARPRQARSERGSSIAPQRRPLAERWSSALERVRRQPARSRAANGRRAGAAEKKKAASATPRQLAILGGLLLLLLLLLARMA